MRNEGSLLKGFTVIELIVVIAIIAVLATIVTTNVMVYVTKGKNAAIKGNMAQLATHGGLYLTDGNDDYSDFCDDPSGKTKEFLDKINEINGGSAVDECLSGEDDWCVIVGLVTTLTTDKLKPVFCVDSTGAKREDKDQDLDCYWSVEGYRCSNP